MCLAATPALAQTRLYVPLTIHTATHRGNRVVEAAFIDARVTRANEIFGPYGIQFTIVSRRTLPERHAALENRDDRDALGAYFARGTLHVFCVASLRDVDEPARIRRGVHWRVRGRPAVHFVIISAISGENVLAHELGHYLGHPEHSAVPGNLMSYEHGPELPVLDAGQRRRMLRRLRSYFATGELSSTPGAR